MKYLRINNEPSIMESYHHRGNGDVRDAIYLKTIFQHHTPVGARRRSNHALNPDYHHILVAKLVRKNELGLVLIRVSLFVMLDLAPLALIWDLLFLASVARRLFQEDAWIQITRVDGAVVKSAMISFHVENTIAERFVMRVSVAVVQFLLNPYAIVVKLKKLYLALNVTKGAKVKHQPVRSTMKIWLPGHGLAVSIVVLNVVDLLTVVNQDIIARADVILKMLYLHTARFHQMLLRLVLVAKRQFPLSSKSPEPIACILFLTVQKNATYH